MPNCFWKVVKSYCLQEHNTLNILSLSYCFFFLHSYLQLVCCKIFQMEEYLHFATIIKVLRAVAAIFRINVALILPIHFFYPTDVLQSESGPLPHHTSPPAAKSAFPINTRPSTATVALYLFHNTFYSIVLPMIIIRETYCGFSSN